jgi:hypothetical protein
VFAVSLVVSSSEITHLSIARLIFGLSVKVKIMKGKYRLQIVLKELSQKIIVPSASYIRRGILFPYHLYEKGFSFHALLLSPNPFSLKSPNTFVPA